MGGHFDNTTFTCPVDGLYFFTYTIKSNERAVVELALDGEPIVGVYHHDQYSDDDDFSQNSNSALVTCRAEQEVSSVACHTQKRT